MRHTLRLLPVAIVAGLALLAAPASAASALTSKAAGLLEGPGRDYAALASLAAGTRVDLIWCGTRDNWCLVEFKNRKGWVPLASLVLKTPRKASSVADGGAAPGKGGSPASTPPAGAPPAKDPKDAELATLPPHGTVKPTPPPITVIKDTLVYTPIKKLP